MKNLNAIEKKSRPKDEMSISDFYKSVIMDTRIFISDLFEKRYSSGYEKIKRTYSNKKQNN